MNRIEIELSKTKIILAIIGSILFIACGIFFTLKPETFISYESDVDLIRIVGIVAIIFFSCCLVYGITKLFDKKVGLTIDEKGITDNSSGISIGFIRWKDIASIDSTIVKGNSFLLLFIKNPDDYIAKAKTIKALLMKANYKMYGTPICISSNSLKIDFQDLKRTVETEFQKNK